MRATTTTVALAAACLGCGGAPGRAEEKLPPQVTLAGVSFQQWEGNELVAKGSATQLTYDRASGGFEATSADVLFPARPAQAGEGRPVTDDLRVSAPLCRGNLAARDVEASGGVEFRSAGGLFARTNSARFEGASLVARGAEPVQVRGPGYALDARSFAFYLLTEELVFEGGVQSALGEGAGALP